MTTEKPLYTIAIKEFVASKQILLFQGLKQDCFSGQIIFQNTQGEKWTFFLYLGRIIYVTGGVHLVRRWRRYIVTYMPQIAHRLSEEMKFLEDYDSKLGICWEYYLLSLWVENHRIPRDVAVKMIRSLVVEVFFDITQAGEILYELQPENRIEFQPVVMIDAEQQIIEAWKSWQAWQEVTLGKYSPNLAPQIKQPEKLQQRTSPKTYEILIRLLDGKHSLRDIAIQKQTDVLVVLRSIMPYISLGLLRLIEIPDLTNSKTISPPEELTFYSTEQFLSSSFRIDNQQKELNKKFIIAACLALNSPICEKIKTIVSVIEYQLIIEQNPLQAIAVMLNCKPDIIFIDSNLPELNGYELCIQLRQLDYFKDIPIIIFVDNVNLIDRVKAKMSGCSELISEPLNDQVILALLTKYLNL